MRLITWTITETQNAAVVRFSGELDMSVYGAAQTAILEAEEAAKPCLVLDLTGLEFMDASGLRLLVAARNRAAASSRRFAVVPGRARRVLELAGLVSAFCLLDAPPAATPD